WSTMVCIRTSMTRFVDERARRFLETQRVAHLATADAAGRPHVVPICFVLIAQTLYVAIDEKPKRADFGRLRRLQNIAANPRVSIVADVYDDRDWSRLGFVLVHASARLLLAAEDPSRPRRSGEALETATLAVEAERDAAIRELRAKYAQ